MLKIKNMPAMSDIQGFWKRVHRYGQQMA